MRNRFLGLGLAAYTALWAGLWWSERQARLAAETERDARSVAEPGAKASARPGRPIVPNDAVPRNAPESASDPEATATGTAEPPTTGGGTGGSTGSATGPTGGASVAAAGAATPGAQGGGGGEIAVDPSRPLEEFDRILPLLRERMGLPIGDRGARDRALVLRTLGMLLDAAPQEIESRLAAALGSEEHFGMFRQIADLLHGVNPERVTQVVRELAESPEPRRRENALAALGLLPDGEAELLWRRMAADPDPGVRQTAIGYPPRQDPAFDALVREVVARETDPVQRGEGMHAMFSARPTQENLDFLLREVKQSSDPAFRTAALEWFGWELTVRDADAIQQLRDLAGPAGGEPAVRRRAAEILLRGGSLKQGLVPRAERARWEGVLAETDPGK